MRLKGSMVLLYLLASAPWSAADAGEMYRVAQGESLVLKLPQSHESKLAVFTPTGHWLYLVDKRLKNPLMTEESFLTSPEIRVDTRSMKATRFENGAEVSVDVFTEPGNYAFIVSDNLETELSKMRSLVISVKYGSVPPVIPADELKFAVVSGVETFHRIRSGSNLYPWDRARDSHNPRNRDEPVEILISNACGFAEVEYLRVNNPGFSSLNDEKNLKPWKAFVQMGEWCQIQEFILENVTLVAYREWKGKRYIVDYAELMVNDDRRLYVDDLRFIEAQGLDELAEKSGDRLFLGDLLKP